MSKVQINNELRREHTLKIERRGVDEIPEFLAEEGYEIPPEVKEQKTDE